MRAASVLLAALGLPVVTGCAIVAFRDSVSGLGRIDGTDEIAAATAQRVGSVDIVVRGGRRRWTFFGPLLPIFPYPPSRTAVIYVLVDATVPRTSELALDSAGILVELPPGQRIGPTAQWGGDASTVIMHEGARIGCGARPLRRTLRADGTWSEDLDNGLPRAITIGDSGCVELLFEVPAGQLARARLRLDGVRVGGAPIIHVPLCLAVGREWRWELLYRWGAGAELAGGGHEGTTCTGAAG